MNRRSAKADMDAMRRKGTTLLRDWGECPDCGERGTLTVTVPRVLGMVIVFIACTPVCGMRCNYPTLHLCRLGSMADRVRALLEVEAKDELSRQMGEILREKQEQKKEEARIFGFS